jgi:asparagine N-glycosylation enzyme membrane subunit Stt3
LSGEIEFLTTAVPVFLSIFIPGFLIALALLKKTKMPLPAIAAFGFILGLVFPPLLLFIYSLFGVLYSPQLVVINLVIVTAIGLLLCMKEGALDICLSFNYKRDAAWVLLLIIMLFAFWARVQSLGPIFYEFDPYYYDQMTQFILTSGSVPQNDSLAWYPYPDSHRNPPITNYLEAQWYAIHGYITNNQQFDKYLLSTIAAVYPPVVAALACFLIFILIAEAYGKKYGLISAGLIAVMPMIIEKLAAGESEEQPWGLFAAFFFYAAYALMISKKDRRFAILAGIATVAATLGSKQDVLVYLVMAGYVGVQSLVNYLKNKSNRELIELNTIVLGFSIVAYGLLSAYMRWEMPSDILSCGSALVFALGLELISQKAKNQEDRINYLAGYLALGVILLFITFIPSFPLQLGPAVYRICNRKKGKSEYHIEHI